MIEYSALFYFQQIASTSYHIQPEPSWLDVTWYTYVMNDFRTFMPVTHNTAYQIKTKYYNDSFI